jgi:transcriptional regulator with XRE-family HTH domain
MPPRAKIRHPFAARLIQLRKAKGFSQYDLADKAGVSQRVVAHYETVVTNPASGTVLRLAKALNVSPDQLMGFKPFKIKEPVSRKTVRSAKLMEVLPPKEQKKVIQYIRDLAAKHNGIE